MIRRLSFKLLLKCDFCLCLNVLMLYLACKDFGTIASCLSPDATTHLSTSSSDRSKCLTGYSSNVILCEKTNPKAFKIPSVI